MDVKYVPNQNLHGVSTPDMIIITPSNFMNSSQELKLIHQQEGLEVMVVTDEQVYNEFSGGLPDATAIKQFLRMFYVREGGNPSQVPKYCLLFGDGTYDNRDILGHGNNHLPVYQSGESLSVTSTFASDDYYAILSDGASMQNTDQLNIGIGRITANTTEEANGVVQKIVNYLSKFDSTGTMLGCNSGSEESVWKPWRNKVVLVSDDEDNNAYFNDIEIMDDKNR